MNEYAYADKPLNNELFLQQLSALALAGGASWERIYLGQPGQYRHVIRTAADLSAPDKARLDAMVANHDSTQRTATQAASDAAVAAQAAAETQDAGDRAQLQVADDALSTYIGLASPTAAQTVAAVKALCRFARYVIRRGVRQGWL